jgi:hypothetical protein
MTATTSAIVTRSPSESPVATRSTSPRPRKLWIRPSAADRPNSPPATAPTARRPIGTVITLGDSWARCSSRAVPVKVRAKARVM